jgi:hypothetical protein
MTEATQAAPKAKKETEITTVTMNDGRIVEFAGKRRLIKEQAIKDGKVGIRLDFVNGETRTFVLPDSLILKFAAHGAEQKLGDEIAGLKDIDDAVMAVDELVERLQKGEWNVARESNGLAGTSVLAKALVEFTGKTPEQIKAFLSGKTQAEKVALRNNPKVKPIVERIEAAKAANGKTIDTDGMLAGLEAA